MAPSSSLPPLFSLLFLFLFLFLSPLPSLSLPQPHPAPRLTSSSTPPSPPPLHRRRPLSPPRPPPPPPPSPRPSSSSAIPPSTAAPTTSSAPSPAPTGPLWPRLRHSPPHRPLLQRPHHPLRLGLPFVPPYLGQSGKVEDMIYGVNYASAAAGILFASGSDLGMHVSLTQQIQQVTDTSEQLALSLGEEAAADLFRRSVFYVSIGSNDFIHYYLRNTSSVQSLYLPWEFNQLLVNTVKQELKNLYNTNVRKFIVMA
uniref:GDSL esterase/lipase 7 n=1 Tax=Ananas comosus var. bracteatus TaxID=296719 RepID=A0A6V7Q8U0_ANACO|nr:unnamed protein product [Ananas comosus var. bracteatus]